MLENISKFDVYVGLALNGIFSGLGCAIGNYFANTHIIKRSQKLINKIRQLSHRKRK